ncbi:MAG: DDE-type integrase/transposase/recombinase [Candidatus Methanomethylicaceae archaeon]
MFYGSCRKVSKVLSLSIEPISKSTIHYLSKKVSENIKISIEKKERRCIAIDETKLKIKKKIVYIWSAIDINSKEILVLEARYGRSCIDALIFLRKVLKLCKNKPKIIVDKGPWYTWALNRLGLEYDIKSLE